MTQSTSVVTPQRYEQGLTYQQYISQIKVNQDRFQENYEGTKLSEGRGTDAPFRKIGAPWINASALARAIECPGAKISATSDSSKSSSSGAGSLSVVVTKVTIPPRTLLTADQSMIVGHK